MTMLSIKQKIEKCNEYGCRYFVRIGNGEKECDCAKIETPISEVDFCPRWWPNEYKKELKRD